MILNTLEAFKRLRNSHVMISQKTVEKAKVLIQPAGGFRIHSIGSEDGFLNKLVLSELSKAFSSIKFHYMGIEMDEQVCDAAEGNLSGVANVELNWSQKIMELLRDDFAPFDLMLMVNCTYYATSLEHSSKHSV